MTQSQDVKRFIALRDELAALRKKLPETGPLSGTQRDFVALAQAEALCDLAATMNNGIMVGVGQ
ncbi:hypothetical protein [Microbacterium sp. LWO13-1.2]|uniref:hypothetical protein n=1 Tax=Microbacterium sp. LWO13-1.2 TaxID=3135262 RepID=UPI0031387E3E